MKTVAIIQARMGSTRLPGKILQNLTGIPMLTRVVNRVKRATTVDEVVVATTVEPADSAIEELVKDSGWKYYRGSQDDVLDRYYHAAKQSEADVIVRITSDCPLIDPGVLDRVVREFQNHNPEYAYVSNINPTRHFPRGLDVEVFSLANLELAWNEDTNPAQREHVTPYFYRNPDRFRIFCVTADADHSAHRWTVDTPEDLALIQRIYDHFGHDHFDWKEVLSLCEAHPDWSELNREIAQKAVA